MFCFTQTLYSLLNQNFLANHRKGLNVRRRITTWNAVERENFFSLTCYLYFYYIQPIEDNYYVQLRTRKQSRMHLRKK